MKGVWGKYALVDLTERKVSEYLIPEDWYVRHLGGRGIGTRILIEEVVRKGISIDPLGEENILVFGTGPMQGTGAPGSGKHVIMGWSPKTGTINESYAGGFFGHELAQTGFDGVIIRGISAEPVFVVVKEEGVAILPAAELWGRETAFCDKVLRERYGERARVACIGPAGERGVRFACIVHDRNRVAGRPGFGAVMGSKNLKAVVVVGDRRKDFADPDGLRVAVRSFAQLTISNPGLQELGRFGTSGGVLGLNELGILPTRNFSEGYFERAAEISGQRMAETILVGRDTCAGCPVRCKRVVNTAFAGEKVSPEYGGPEYETIAAFGSLCLIDDLSAIALANQKCNQYGLDTISTGVLIAYLMEATEKGLIKEGSDLAIHWGDAKRMIALIDSIGMCKGPGDFLAQGLAKVAEEIGGQEFAVHIKGVEVPLHEPRGKKGLAISYATSPRGATHLEAIHDTMLEGENPTPELGVTEPADRLSWEDKPRLCKIYEDLYSFVNSCILCGFVSWDQSVAGEYYPFPVIRDVLRAATGIDLDVEEMMRIGERNYAIRRIAAAYSGYTQADDDLPPRLKEPLKNGACAGERIENKVLSRAIRQYYELRGFDAYGPTDETLRRLGCNDLVGLIHRPSGEGK